jgi:hypothetical protein
MFPLLDRVEHECCNRFPGESDTHPGRSALATSIGQSIFLSQTWGPGDCPVEPAALNDFFHGK